jgi:MFS transporter, OFA family, oxalate/formate antiporter
MVSVVPILSTGMATLMIPIAQDTGWSRGDVSTLLAAGLAGLALGAPLVGQLIQRVGARPVIIASSVLFPLSLLAFSTAHSFPIALALAAALGIVGAGVSHYSYIALLPYYFNKRLGLSLGVAMAGFGIGNALVPLFVQHLESAHNWREIYRIIAGVVCVIALPNALLLLRTPPSRARLNAPDLLRGDAEANVTAPEALRSRVFIQMALCFFIATVAITGFAIHLTSLMSDRGYSAAAAARIFSFFGVGFAIARFLGGFLLDYVDARWIGGALLVGAAVAAALLASGISGPLLLLSVFLLAAANGMDGDLVPYMTRRYFGLRAYSVIYGALGLIYQIATPVGSILMGRGFDLLGGYDALLWFAAAAVVAAAALLVTLGRSKPDALSNA